MYQKLPKTVEAIQWTGKNLDEIKKFCPSCFKFMGTPPTLIVPTLEGNMKAIAGDYIIKGIKGEFYPCKEKIFLETYKLIKEIPWD